jgi:hypothetical protein
MYERGAMAIHRPIEMNIAEKMNPKAYPNGVAIINSVPSREGMVAPAFPRLCPAHRAAIAAVMA